MKAGRESSIRSVVCGYVTSGSMEPEIDADNGFVTILVAVTGDPKSGVGVYESIDGKLVTHRVVDVTTGGYVTRDDANPIPIRTWVIHTSLAIRSLRRLCNSTARVSRSQSWERQQVV